MHEVLDYVPSDFHYIELINISEKLKDNQSDIKQNINLYNEYIERLVQQIHKIIEEIQKTIQIIQSSESDLTISSLLTEHFDSQSKPHVLMLTHEYEQNKTGGVKTSIQKLVKHLKQKYTVDVIERSIEVSDSGTFYYYLGAGKKPSIKFKDMSHFFIKHPNLKLTIIHVQSINFAPGPYGWVNGGLDELKNMYPKVPIVCTIHSLVKYESTRTYAKWMEYSIKCQDQTIRLSQKFIVLHEFGKKLLKHYYPYISDKNIFVIPNGIEITKTFSDHYREVENKISRIFGNKIKLIYVGRISREKGLFEVVKAISHFPNIEFHIVGPDQNYEGDKLKEESKNHGIENRVIFHGSIKITELTDMYNKIKPDIAILASHFESFPLFALEAISHGVPLIISDIDGPREIYSPYRLHDSPDGERSSQTLGEIDNPLPGFKKPLAIAIDPKNHESIINAIQWTLDHPKEVHTILKNSMEEISTRYNWKSVSKATIDVYKSFNTDNKLISQYEEEDINSQIIDLNLPNKKNIKIGIIGHFMNDKGVVPDGVARWNETVFRYLRSKNYDVEGWAFVGSARNNNGIVHYSNSKTICAKLETANIDVAIVRGAAHISKEIIDTLNRRGIPTIYVMPYWGVWKETYELSDKPTILITGTQDYAMKIKSKTRNDVRFVPWPIDTEFWTKDKSNFIKKYKPDDWPENTFNLCYVGRMGIAKHIHKIIEPFKEFVIDKGYKNMRLILLGPSEGNMGEKIREEIRKNNMSSYVHFHEEQFTSNQVKQIINSCDVFIFPTSFETYGQSHLEAISCGIPTVVTRTNGFTKYSVPSMANIPDYDFSFEPGELYDKEGNMIKDGVDHNWNECFSHIKCIYDNPKKAQKIMKKWSSFIKKTMSLNAIGKKIETSIQDAYSKRSNSDLNNDK